MHPKKELRMALSQRGGRRRSSSPVCDAGAGISLLLLLVAVGVGEGRKHVEGTKGEEISYMATKCRKHAVSIAQFGGVGDGVTSNTQAFRAAVDHLSKFGSHGGGLLYVPAGRWVTGSFNLTSHFTLFLHRKAVLLGSQDMNEWPLIDPLPSYGRGRDLPGGRYSSLITGFDLKDVIITGDNGTIDGQGEMWWKKYRNNELNYTRGKLIEILRTDGILISNITLVNSPAWNIHPVYSRNVIVSGVTILAPIDSPNTDGIDPDSCSQVRIEDSYVVSGDDCVSVKSGWDEYGVAVGMPSKHITVKRFTCISPDSAVVALGSEMSGGIQDVRMEDVTAIDSEVSLKIKTAVGRGGYVKDIFARDMKMHTMRWAFRSVGTYNSHPDDKYDPKAVPIIDNISISNVIVKNATMAARFEGLEERPFSRMCISNTTIDIIPSKKLIWNCTGVSGVTSNVTPQACPQLPDKGKNAPPCPFPNNRLSIEDVTFKTCFQKV